MMRSRYGWMALIAALIWASPGVAVVSACKARADKKTGVIKVKAKNLAGVPQWGDAPGLETNAFANAPSCYDAITGKMKNCLLADEVSTAATMPPPNCRICVGDGVGSCCTWVKGCTPGIRECVTVSESENVPAGGAVTVTALCPAGWKVSGGGGSHADLNLVGLPPVPFWEYLPLSASSATATDDGWTCSAQNDSADPSGLSCTARCCRMP